MPDIGEVSQNGFIKLLRQSLRPQLIKSRTDWPANDDRHDINDQSRRISLPGQLGKAHAACLVDPEEALLQAPGVAHARKNAQTEEY